MPTAFRRQRAATQSSSHILSSFSHSCSSGRHSFWIKPGCRRLLQNRIFHSKNKMMMKCTVALLALVVATEAFTSTTLSNSRSSLTTSYAYIPDGFTAESYKKFKEDEKKKLATKNLGKLGPRGFKSRSFQSFHEALERGEAEHLLPVFNAKEKVKAGKLKVEDIPYMQRGGSWDNSDVKGSRKKKWLQSDKEYAGGGYKKEQSVSIFGYGEGLDWTGSRARMGPAEGVPGKPIKFAKNYKAPNVNNLKGVKPSSDDTPKKKLFGLF